MTNQIFQLGHITMIIPHKYIPGPQTRAPGAKHDKEAENVKMSGLVARQQAGPQHILVVDYEM